MIELDLEKVTKVFSQLMEALAKSIEEGDLESVEVYSKASQRVSSSFNL